MKVMIKFSKNKPEQNKSNPIFNILKDVHIFLKDEITTESI